MRRALIAARKAHNLSQHQLALLLKTRLPTLRINRWTVSRWEHGLSDIPGGVLVELRALFAHDVAVLHAQDPTPQEEVVAHG